MTPSRFGALDSASDHGQAPAPGLRRTRVWDLPTRVFHWALAAAVIGLVVTGTVGAMEWHFRLGYVVMALLAFRVVWGFVGGRWSRFGTFLYAPRAVLAYLRGRAHPDHLVGHNPLGALSVFALLAVLVLQVATGLVSDDEIAASGPLTRFVSNTTVSLASNWHSMPGKWLVIVLASLHVLAVLFYVTARRQSLVRPMLSGDKLAAAGVEASVDSATTRFAALMVFLLCMGAAWWVSTLRT